jgi:acyl-coenzyme A thioesterase PaaI-like protein
MPIEDSFIGVMGLEMDDLVEVGHRRGRLAVVPRVCQPMGIVHGGIYAAIAEMLASIGNDDGKLCATSRFTIAVRDPIV